jgi:thymidylate kinase
LSAIIKPPIALIDNIIFYILNRSKKDKEIFIYDRFICATQIKLSALNYHSRWLKYIWRNISTDQTFVIDIDPELSLQRQLERNDPYTYPIEILQREREGYMDLGKAKGYTIIDNSDSLQAALNTVIETLKSKNMI